MLYLTAFITGLLGSFHCLGMCGPLAMIVPPGLSYGRFISGRLLYNAGRISTYSLIGLLLGTFGRGLSIAGVQQYVSIGAGALLLVYAFLQLVGKKSGGKILFPAYRQAVEKAFSRFLSHPALGAQYMVGLLNGLLPCGLVYIALAGALATSGPLEGAAYMALFGAGTLPVMVAVSFASRWVGRQARTAINRAMPYIVAGMALLFIVRGLNLGIPYLSPKINANNEMECCKKPQ